MGWWHAHADGGSLAPEDTGLVWGDEPADAIDAALDRIDKAFREYYGRPPTYAELKAGLAFSAYPRYRGDQ